MLKQILATSALIAIAAVSVQSASAADKTKFRQLVVEPSGSPTGDPALLKKTKLQPLLLVQPGKGIATPGGAPANAGNGNGQTGQVAQFIVAPGQGIPTQAGSKGGGQKDLPEIAALPGGIATPIKVADGGGDPGAPAGNKAFPLITTPPGVITSPAGNPAAGAAAPSADAGAPAAGASPVIDPPPTVPPAAADAGQPAPTGADPGAAAASQPPLAPGAAVAGAAIQSPNDLYSLLTSRGYGVEILKHDQYGNRVFYVTTPGQPQGADLLLVDATYGKVLERKHVAAYGYDHPAGYAPGYSAAYAGEANCDHSAGY